MKNDNEQDTGSESFFLAPGFGEFEMIRIVSSTL